MLTIVRFEPYRRLLIALALTSLTACSQLPRQGNNIAHLDALIAQQEYGRADRLLAALDKATDVDTRKLVERRQRALPALIAGFERKTLDQVEQLVAQNQWQQALALIEQTIKQLPRTTPLVAERDKLLAGQQEYLQQLALRSDLLLAEQLPVRNALLEQMLEADPDQWSVRWQLKRQQRQAADLANDLLGCVDQALAANKAELAGRCLSAAARVANEAQQARLQEARVRLARVATAPAVAGGAAALEQQQRTDRLKRDYRTAIDAGKWLEAQDVMRQLQLRAAADRDVVQWQSELQAVIRQQVALGIQKGQALYSQGRIQQALDIWRDTARLDPEHQVLQGHIRRAERFLGNLQRLDS